MNNTNAVFVVGAKGHGKSVVSVLQASGFEVSKILDDDPETWGESILGVDVAGPVLEKLAGVQPLGIIGIGDNGDRKAQAEELPDVEWLTLIYPGAYVNPTAQIGSGTVVFPGAVIGADAVIGKHVIISGNCTIGHDTKIADYAHVVPGVQVAGAVRLGEGSMLGIGCCVVPEINIGEWATIGAGAAVVRDVAPSSTVLGVAAKPR